MASAILLIIIILSTMMAYFLVLVASTFEPICPIEAIYQFGDSISDTGNQIRSNPVKDYAARLPYGQTYFHRPTGRWSNGLLMIDFIATDFKLPLLNPYLEKDVSFDNGVNFAVASSTALDYEFFEARNISMNLTKDNAPLTLSAQLNWFRTHLNSPACQSNSDRARKLRRSVVIVEIGGNDENYSFFQGKSIPEVQSYLPDIVRAIVNAVWELIRYGAVRVAVAGNFPIGCLPIYLTFFPSNDPKAYDDKGCLRDLNAFAMTHNNYLQEALARLQQEFPHAVIIYLDYYNAFQSVLYNAESLGLEPESTLKACCGTGGTYNFDRTASKMCGTPGVPVCPDPDKYMSWDGIHPTQKTYQLMSEFLIDHCLSRIRCF